MKINISSYKHSFQRILLTVFFLTLSLGQLERLQLTSQVAIYIHELILMSCVIIFLPNLILEYKVLAPFVKKNKFLSGFLSFLLLQTIIYQLISFQLVSFLYMLRLFLYIQIFPIVRITVKQQLISKKDVSVLLIIVSGVITILGVFQYVLLPDTRWLTVMGWDDHYYRLISTLFDPGYTGLIISIGLLIFLHKFNNRSALQHILLIGVFILAILLTYSRATYVSLFIGLLLLSYQKKHIVYLIIVLAFCATIPLLPRPASEGVRLERTASISSRITSNQQALQSLSLAEVIWGRGFYRNIPEAKSVPNHAIAPDNSFIFIFTSIGIIGSLLLIASLYQIRYLFNDQLTSTIILVISVHSLFNNSLFYIWTIAMLASTLAITISTSKIKAKA